MFDFIIDGNGNVGHISHQFRDIHSLNVVDLDLDR